MSTRYPWHLRRDMAEGTVAHMQARGKGTGQPSTPHVLALWDAIGISHELNGFRNDAAGWIKRYLDERSLEIGAVECYDGLRQALNERAVKAVEQFHAVGQSSPTGEMNRLRAPIALSTHDDAAATAFGQQYYQLSQEYRNGDLTLAELQARRAPLVQRYAKDPAALEAALAREDDIKRATARGTQQAIERERARVQVDSPWEDYEERIDRDAVRFFKEKRAAFEIAAADIIERRTLPLLRWLEAQPFLDTLKDFHGENVEDGLLFTHDIGEAIFGIGSCKAGRKKIEEWVKDCKASMESNLLWRVVALNQNDARAELDQMLAEAERHRDAQTMATAVTWGTYLQKAAKAFADTYKKAQGVYDANVKASSQAGSTAFGVRLASINTRGTDKFAITVGEAVFRFFRVDKLADFASEKIIQHIFCVRGFVNPLDSQRLIIAQSGHEALAREQTLRRLRSSRAFLATDIPAMRTAQGQALRAAWTDFRASGTADSVSAVRDARLAVVVGLIEGVNFAKLLADCKNKGDTKSYFSLLASGMVITSAMFDVAATAAKNLPGMGNASLGYQQLKLWGGVLASGASFVLAVLDAREADKVRNEGYGGLARLYLAKSFAQAASGIFAVAVTFTYSAPLISQMLGRGALGTAASAVGKRAAAIIALRILGMGVGAWLTVGTFGIQVLIWWVAPDALDKWMDRSAFGQLSSEKGYKTAKEQDENLEAALVELGLK